MPDKKSIIKVIRRRFHAGLRNFHETYRQCVDHWQKFNNSGDSPVLKDESSNSP